MEDYALQYYLQLSRSPSLSLSGSCGTYPYIVYAYRLSISLVIGSKNVAGFLVFREYELRNPNFLYSLIKQKFSPLLILKLVSRTRGTAAE